jgi:uncharacterized protein YhaN
MVGLEQLAEQAEREVQQAQNQKRELAQELGGLKQKLKDWADDREISGLRKREEELKGEVVQLADRYAVDRLSMKLLTKARDEFQAHYQPRLIQGVSAAFAELTAGRYVRVFLEPGERELKVRSREGIERVAQALSRGTREQLYLAFRVAVVKDFSVGLGPLPLLLDDILVNFDHQRADAAIRVFSQLAERQQIIAFTCHEHLRNRFRHFGASCSDLLSKQQLLLRLHSA